eukprot:5123925-Pyramimonas_sp.AAC.1
MPQDTQRSLRTACSPSATNAPFTMPRLPASPGDGATADEAVPLDFVMLLPHMPTLPLAHVLVLSHPA